MMATSKWWIKRGDTLPVLTAELTDYDLRTEQLPRGPALDLTSVQSVQLNLLRKFDASGAAVSGEAAHERAASVDSPPTAGVVSYTFVAGDWTGGTPILAGTYEAEWELTYNSGGIRTVPTEGYGFVIIREDLD